MSEAQINSTLRSIDRNLRELQGNQVALHQSVAVVSQNQELTRGEVTDLRAKFEDFLRRDVLAKELQLAQTRIIAVRQQLETEFGYYEEARRLATGTLQAMDAGIVTHEMIRQASEERMLLTPRYWLTPALVALAAWIRDDQPLAERAMAQALSRDNDKTSLLFALVLRRHGRDAATARWVEQYVARQDPSNLSREFTVIVDAVATGVLGEASKPILLGQLDVWYERLRTEPAVTDNQVARWSALIDGLRPTLLGGFTVLPQVSPTWPLLLSVLQGAAVHGKAEKFFRDLFDGPVGDSPDLRRRVDDILDNLVRRYDDEEAPRRREESRLQAIIDHDGDKVAAKKVSDAEASVHDTTVDLLTLLTNAAFYPEKSGASKGTQRLAVALTKDWIVAADATLDAANVAAVPAQVDLDIEGWRGRLRRGGTEAELVGGLARHVDEETARQVAAIKFTGGPLVAAVVAGVVTLLALITAVGGSTGGAVFFLLVAAGAGAYALNDYRHLPGRRAAAVAAGEVRKARALATLRGAVAETADWYQAWEAEAARGGPFRLFMAGLVRDAYVAAAPDQRRGVLR